MYSIGSVRSPTFLLSSWLCSVHKPVLSFVSFLRYFLLSPLAFRARFPSNHTSGREILKSSASSRVTFCSVSRLMGGCSYLALLNLCYAKSRILFVYMHEKETAWGADRLLILLLLLQKRVVVLLTPIYLDTYTAFANAAYCSHC